VHTEHPFAAAHSERTVFSTDALRESLARLDHGLGAREPFLLVSGDPGTGKTTLVLEATALWGDRARVVVLTHPTLTRAELVEEIARRLGAKPSAGATTPELIACLEHALADVATRGRTPVLVIEDAHQASDELLDELRLLVNSEARAQRAIEVVLVGPPALEHRLAGPALAAIRERVSVECRVVALTHKETRQYLYHRVRAAGGNGPKLFPRRTCSEIHDRTQGVPRAVNSLAAEALRLARVAGVNDVTHDHVRSAADAQVRPLAAAPIEPKAVAPIEPTAAAPRARRAVLAVSTPEAACATAAETRSLVVSTSETVAPDAATPETVAPVTAAPGTAAPEAATPETLERETKDSEPDIAPAQKVTAVARADSELARAPIERLIDGAAVADPRVQQWVSRFIGNQGPPRIGVAFAFEEYELSAEEDTPVIGGSLRSDAEASTARSESEPGSSESRSLDPFAEPKPRRRAPAARRPRPRSRVAGPALAIVVIVVAALGTVMFLSNKFVSLPGRAEPVSSASATALDRLARTTLAVTTSQPQRTGSTPVVPGPAVALPRAALAQRTVTSHSSAETADPGDANPASAAPSRLRLTLEIGSSLDAQGARLERDRLAAETGLEAWVVAAQEYGGESYRIVLGVFSTTERAEASANILLERGLVTGARVVPLPPRRARQ